MSGGLRSWADRAGWALAALYLLAALHGLGAADIVGDDEAREAGIVQDVAAGHWLWPEFDRTLLPDKPPLYHWLAAVPCALTGFSEAAVRLPSALAGAALVGVTARAGGTLLGQPDGLVAAGLLATMPALFDHVRVARPDALLVLLLTAALVLGFRAWQDGRRRDATAALALLGLATLAKGPVAPALFALTLGGLALWERAPGRLRRLVTAPGAVALALLGGGWYAIALAGWRGRFVREHLVGRYLRNLAGGLIAGQPYSPRPLLWHLRYYPEHLPLVALPWTPLVAYALWRLWRRGGFGDPRTRFLIAWALAPVIAFTPAEWKLRYYLLPSLPALALLAAPAAVALLRGPVVRRSRVAPRRAAIALGAGLAIVAGVGAVVVRPALLSASDRSNLDALLAATPGGAPAAAALLGVGIGVLVGVTALEAWPIGLGLLAAGSAVWMVAGVPALEQAASRRDSLRAFAAAVAARFPPPAPIVFSGAPIRPLVVYLGRDVPVAGPDGIAAGVGVIATEPEYRRLVEHARAGPPLALAEGRVGNLARDRIVLAEGVGPRPP
ncbi:MAG TPA: glycosyltransferase family 39 protein [Candidatus Binatia bacterium]|nr:glycosyltransferase family 39 protein [Candidatus Binatia bacterium]